MAQILAYMQGAVVLRAPNGIFVEPFFRPEQLFDCVVESLDSAGYRGIAGKLSQRVIMQ